MTQGKSIEHDEREVQKDMESQDTSRNLSVIRKQSCPLSVEINISWFSTNWWPIKRCLITNVSHKKHFMMGKSKELSQDLRNVIVAKLTDDIGYRRISILLNVPVSTVGAIIRKWKEQFHHKPATIRCSSQDFWVKTKYLSEELSKSQRSLVECYRKTWN